MTPGLSQGGDKLRLGAFHPCCHLVGQHHGDVVAGRQGEELLGEAVQEACPLRELIKEGAEGGSHTVNDQEADPRMGRQEARQQVELRQQLHVIMAAHLKDMRP